MSLEVIGAGLGRTGTKSLQVALEVLGYDKCYHMEELLRNPKGVHHWKNAYAKKDTNWKELFSGYKAILDFPGCMFYPELAKLYPKAKIILGVRNPERWYKSAFDTIFKFDPGLSLKLRMFLKMPFSAKARNLFKLILFQRKLIWDGFFEGKFETKAFVIDKFNKHIEEVKQNVDPNRLLIFQVKDGWEPLCKFLEKPVPGTNFPHINKGGDFHKWARSIVRDTLNN